MDQALPSIEARSAMRRPYPEEANAPEHRTVGLRLREGPLFGCGSLVRQPNVPRPGFAAVPSAGASVRIVPAEGAIGVWRMRNRHRPLRSDRPLCLSIPPTRTPRCWARTTLARRTVLVVPPAYGTKRLHSLGYAEIP